MRSSTYFYLSVFLPLALAIPSPQEPGTPKYECHANCGNTISLVKANSAPAICDLAEFVEGYNACLQCAGPDEFDIWQYYGRSLSPVGKACGLPSEPGAAPEPTTTAAPEEPSTTAPAEDPSTTEDTPVSNSNSTSSVSVLFSTEVVVEITVTEVVDECSCTENAEVTTTTGGPEETTSVPETTAVPEETEVPITTTAAEESDFVTPTANVSAPAVCFVLR